MFLPELHGMGHRVCDPARWRIPWRVIPDWEWVIVESGQGTVHTDSGHHAVQRDSLMLFPPGLRHAIETDADDPMTFSFVHFDGVDETGRALLTFFSPVHAMKNGEACRRLAKRMLAANCQLGPSREPLLAGLMLEWIALMMAEREASDSSRTGRTRLETLGAVLRSQPARNWTVREMAACLHIGPDALAREINGCTGERPTWFRDRIRLEEVLPLLEETDLTMQEIALRCGWEDPFYLSRRFRQLLGQSPAEWRAAARRTSVP